MAARSFKTCLSVISDLDENGRNCLFLKTQLKIYLLILFTMNSPTINSNFNLKIKILPLIGFIDVLVIANAVFQSLSL
jgi:hypothetical protein